MANKKSLSERDICSKYINPALQKAGWNIQTQIREEVSAIVLLYASLTGDGVKQRVREKLLKDCKLHTIIMLHQSFAKGDELLGQLRKELAK